MQFIDDEAEVSDAENASADEVIEDISEFEEGKCFLSRFFFVFSKNNARFALRCRTQNLMMTSHQHNATHIESSILLLNDWRHWSSC